MRWVSLGLALVGAITALVAWFVYQSTEWIIIGAVIAFVGLWFGRHY